MKQPVKNANENFATFPGITGADGKPVGSILIHEGSIASIIRKSALSVEQVTRISGSSFIDNIAELVGSKKIHDREVVIRFTDNGLEIDIPINVRFGNNIGDVAREVQRRIMDNVQKSTGMNVVLVNVCVRELEDAPVAPVASAEKNAEVTKK